MANETEEVTGIYDFVPSDQGECCALFLTAEERNFLAKLLVTRFLTHEADKPMALAIKDKLPRLPGGA